MSNNQIQKSKFSVAVQTKSIQELMLNTLGDKKKVQSFVTNISSAVIANPELQKCNTNSIICAGLLGETLNLKTGVLGQYYLIPFDKKEKVPKDGGGYEWKVVDSNAQFVLGYKGLIQLAIRSGYYKKIVATEIKEGELIKFNPLEEEIEVQLIEDFEERAKANTIGYYGMFEFTNGFRKAIYWSKNQMEVHADKYSQAFNLESLRKLENNQIPEKELYKYSSNWYKNFDEMGKKTILRQLFSKYGILSTELQQAIEFEDRSVSIDNGSFLPDVPEDTPDIIDDPIPAETANETEQINFDSL